MEKKEAERERVMGESHDEVKRVRKKVTELAAVTAATPTARDLVMLTPFS